MTEPGSSAPGRRLVLSAGIVGLVLAATLIGGALFLTRNQLLTRFTENAAGIEAVLAARMRLPVDATDVAATLFDTSLFVDRDQFRHLADHLRGRFPFTDLLLYAQEVPEQDRAAFTAARRAEGFVTFAIRDRIAPQAAPAPARESHFPIIYVAPLSPLTARLIGLDLATATDWPATPHPRAPVSVAPPPWSEAGAPLWLIRGLYRGRSNTPGPLRGLVALRVDSDRLLARAVDPAPGIHLSLALGDRPPFWRLDGGPAALPLFRFTRDFRLPFAGTAIHGLLSRQVTLADFVGLPLALGTMATGLALGLLALVVRGHLRLGAMNRRLEDRVAERTAQLSRSEAGLATAQRIAGLGSWHHDRGTDTLEWSAQTCRLFGVDPQSFRPSQAAFLDFLHPGDRAGVVAQLDEAAAGHRPFDIEHRIIRRDDGTIHWVHQRGEHIYGPQGDLLGAFGTIQDITERKAMELDLKRSRTTLEVVDRLRSQFLADPDPLVMYDRLLTEILALTNSAFGFIGDVLQDADGRAYMKCYAFTNIAWDDATRTFYERNRATGFVFRKLDNLFGKVITDRRVMITNDPAHHPDAAGLPPGHPPVTSFMGLPVFFGDSLVGEIGLANRPGGYDQDLYRELQPVVAALGQIIVARWDREARQAAEQALQASNRDLQAFAYSISHDLREPLRTIASYLTLVDRRYRDRLDDDGREFIDLAVGGSRRLSRMISDLVAYSRVETQGQPFAACDSGDLVTEALANLAMPTQENGATIQVAPDLPRIHADRSQGIRVFQNLIANALKYQAPDRKPVIDIAAQRDGGSWMFTVADNGIGMAADQMPRIFDLFHRLGDRAATEGSGIGLAVVKRIIERHGGRIEVDSTPGVGSTFRFTLPAAD